MERNPQDSVDRTFFKDEQWKKKVNLLVERATSMQEVTCYIDERPVAIFSTDQNGDVILDIRKQDGITLAGDVNLGGNPEDALPSVWNAGQGTNWEIKKDEVHFTNPKSKATIALPRMSKPGRLCPTNIPPVYGQPDMVFALAMSLSYGDNSLLSGPTGTGKTTVYAFLAQLLGWNFIRVQIDPKTEGTSLIGEYLPVGAGHFEWCDGPVTEAVRLSLKEPTILVLDELSRIGNVAELSRMYSLLDDGRSIALPEKAHENNGEPEVIHAGKLFIGATMNPADDEGADYIGVKELDPALMSRFPFAPEVPYPSPKIEAKALVERVPGMTQATAERMVLAATKIRESAIIHFPMSFRELVSWAKSLPYYDFKSSAEVAFITKAHPMYRSDIRNIVKMV